MPPSLRPLGGPPPAPARAPPMPGIPPPSPPFCRWSTIFCTPAQPSRPAVPSMNPHTMNWSLRLSRWKHMVVTSLSAAPLQIGSDCDRQKLRLHWLQDDEEELPFARRASRCGLVSSSSAPLSRESCWSSSAPSASSTGSVVPSDGGWCCEGGLDGEPPLEDLGLISMIVLLVKQVHLQNVGAAV